MQRMPLAATVLTACAVFLCPLASSSLAGLSPKDFVDIRRIEEPALKPGAGPSEERAFRPAGISNRGDLFGICCGTRAADFNDSNGLRYLRSTQYAPGIPSQGGDCATTFGGATPCGRAQRFAVAEDLIHTGQGGGLARPDRCCCGHGVR